LNHVTQHHQGLLVGNVERSARFYVDAFGGRELTRPVVLEGRAAEMVMDGPPGTRYSMCLVQIGTTVVELFSFLGDARPAWARPAEGRLPHFGLQVEDVGAALERIERAGGSRVFPRVERWGRVRVIYVSDPDGNIIELLDAPPEAIAEEAKRMFPEAAPLPTNHSVEE
jgi:catechol 2,3-dioxygenase-like lactoylglutathione lyase family enzyme